ncbi:MAG TPA: S-layer homology domain-containing protein, partial [Symbiobacteriaceae bacterium]|nr:S-layer homology domain-containing protein [Symbiobacteriaceae bacterium]
WTLTGTAAADELAGWVYRDIVFADGQFVTVQHHGHVRTSVDGVDWRLGDTLNAGAYRGQATVADSRFFVPALLATSADGAAWAPLETGGRVRSVGYGDGVYVAVGEGGLTLTSPDGLTWADPLPDRLPGLNAIASAGGGYVAVGRLGYSVTSPDGITWKPGPWSRNLLREWQAPNYVTLVYGNGRYVALDANGGKLETSTDGVTWRRTWDTGVPAPDGALIFAGGRFVAGTSGGLVISGDGETWQQVYPADRATFTGLAWDGAQYVAAVITGDTRRPLLLSSIDGEDWHVRTAPADRLLSLTYGADKFVALAMRTEGDRAGTVYLLTSRDGLEWTTGSDVPFQKVRYENGLFLANSTELYTSADGENWRAQPTATPVWGAAFLNGRLAVVGANGSVTLSEPVCGIFLDLPASDPACPAVQALVERKVVTGYPDGAFQPEGPVRRAELAKMLTLALGKAPLPDAPLAFTDTYGHWAAAHGYLQAAVDAGAMNGYPDGSFRPDGQVTRADLVKTVLAASDSQPAALKPTYSDVAPDAWYAGWVAAAEQAGLVGPGSHLWSGPTFAPDQPATRAEVVRLLVK